MKENKNPQLQEIDLQREATQVLITLSLLEKSYSGPYLAKILTGENQFGWQDESHTSLQSFGSLENLYTSQIEDIIYFLIGLNFIEVKDEIFGNLDITELGEAYLQEPQPLSIERGKLFKPWYEVELTKEIRTWRMDLAKEFFKKPYQIFTNYTLSLLVKKRPTSAEALTTIPGLDILSEEEKLSLIQIIQEMVRKIEVDNNTQIYRKAYAPSKRKIKELFEAGLSLEEIAKRRKLKLSTAKAYLIILHNAGEIDLIPWIEENMDALILHKMVEYFKSAGDKGLKVAAQVLELDYDTLKLGKVFTESRVEQAA